MEALDPEHVTFLPLPEIVSYLDEHPEIVEISREVNEEYWARFNREHGSFTMSER